jgi:hypothetical protein
LERLNVFGDKPLSSSSESSDEKAPVAGVVSRSDETECRTRRSSLPHGSAHEAIVARENAADRDHSPDSALDSSDEEALTEEVNNGKGGVYTEHATQQNPACNGHRRRRSSVTFQSPIAAAREFGTREKPEVVGQTESYFVEENMETEGSVVDNQKAKKKNKKKGGSKR